MSDYTVYEKMRAADRETRLRRIFKRTNIERGSPVTPKLEYQIKVMQEIADEYRAKWDGVIPNLSIEDVYMQ